MAPHTILNSSTPQPGSSRSRLSANSTNNATHATPSSSMKRIAMTNWPTGPKLTYARSANVTKFRSSSRHLPSMRDVYTLVAAATTRNVSPTSHPAYLMPKGRLRMPTPTRTLVLFITVWYIVLWPMTSMPTVPSSASTRRSRSGSRSLSGICTPVRCCSRYRSAASSRPASVMREPNEP